MVDKFILQLELQLADRNVHIELDDEAREWLTERGYDKLYGARPMGRLVQEKIKQPLAEELLFGKLVHGGEVKVRIKDNAPGLRDHSGPAQAVQGQGREGTAQVGGQAQGRRVRSGLGYQKRLIASAGVIDAGTLCPLGMTQIPKIAPVRSLQLYSTAGAKLT